MVPPDEMGFKFIQHVQQKESRSHNLTKLPADFFESLAVHIERLRTLDREEKARDPMSTTANLVQNELRNTLQLAQEIVLLRLRKMASRAVDSLEGGKVDLRSLTPREKDLFDQLAKFMAGARIQLYDPQGTAKGPASGEGGPATKAPPAAPLEPSAEEAPTSPGEQGEGEVAGEGEETVLVHVLKDTPPFAGEGGRTYSLSKGDLVSVPHRVAEVLLSRGMVELVER